MLPKLNFHLNVQTKKKKLVEEFLNKTIVNPLESIFFLQTSLYSFLKCWKVHPANVYVTLTILLWAVGN